MDIYNFEIGAITAVGVSILVIVSIVGLIVWNGKTKAEAEALKRIDEKLEAGRVSATIMAEGEAAHQVQEPTKLEELTVVNQTPDEGVDLLENEQAQRVQADEPEVNEPSPEPIFLGNRAYNVGKSGKVYSREELLMQIKN
ncbi:MAG: hypothetical protein RR626_02100 [Anaerovoracaceae bacterium]